MILFQLNLSLAFEIHRLIFEKRNLFYENRSLTFCISRSLIFENQVCEFNFKNTSI